MEKMPFRHRVMVRRHEAARAKRKSSSVMKSLIFQKVTQPDLILALTQDASDKYVDDGADQATVIVDEAIVLPETLHIKKVFRVPILETARHDVGKEIVANVVALGFIAGLTNVVSRESLEAITLKRLPKGAEDLNRMALQTGYDMANQM